MKKYIKLYKASALVFVLGGPAIIGIFIGLGMAAGVTAHLCAHLIKTFERRRIYYILTLAASVASIIVCLIIFLLEGSSARGEISFSVLPLLGIFGVIFLGIAAAFAARLYIWQQERAYYKRVESGKSGVNTYKGEQL
jgi:hypothetical protein